MTRPILVDQDLRAQAKADYIDAQYVLRADFINDVAEAAERLFEFIHSTARDTDNFAAATAADLRDVAEARDRFVVLLDTLAQYGTRPLLDGSAGRLECASSTVEIVRSEPASADMRPVAVGVLDYLIAAISALRDGVLSGDAIGSDFFLTMASLDLATSWLGSIVGFNMQTCELGGQAVAAEAA